MATQKLLIRPDASMDESSYDYNKALLEKLIQLVTENRVHQKGTLLLTPLAGAICQKLSVKTAIKYPERYDHYEMSQFVANVKEFLAIFESRSSTAESWDR